MSSNAGRSPSFPGERPGTGTNHHNPVVAVFGRPTYAVFPGLEDTEFGDGEFERDATVGCAVLREHFEKKEVLKARVNFMLYQVLHVQRSLSGNIAGALCLALVSTLQACGHQRNGVISTQRGNQNGMIRTAGGLS